MRVVKEVLAGAKYKLDYFINNDKLNKVNGYATNLIDIDKISIFKENANYFYYLYLY